MECRPKKDFRLKELIFDIKKKELTKEEEILLKFFQRDSGATILERARDLYYYHGPRDYDDWLEDDMRARMFWEDIKNATEDEEWMGKIKLTPDDRDALEDARLGRIGIELFAHIIVWFYDHGFIRSDVTIWNCRLFRYFDSYLITKKNIILGIFKHYDAIRDIEVIHQDVVDCLKNSSISENEMQMLEEQVDNDERFFETGVSAITLTEYRKEEIHLINKQLSSLSEEIYHVIFNEA